MIPNGYIPRKISSFPLPSLVKISKKKLNEPEPLSPEPDTRDQKFARKLRAEIEKGEFIVEQLREAAWAHQEAKEAAATVAIEAKAEAKRLREEHRRKQNENKIRGSGVWSRYEYLSLEQLKRREEERTKVTSGTRRGGRFRNEDEDGEMRRLAEDRRRMLEGKKIERSSGKEETEGVEEEEKRGEEAQKHEGKAQQDEEKPKTPPRPAARPRRSGSGFGPFYVEPKLADLDIEADATASLIRLLSRSASTKMAARRSYQPVESTSKRRGRPPGSGHLQRAAAAAAAVQAEDKARVERLNARGAGYRRRVRPSEPSESTTKGDGEFLAPSNVMTSGIELPELPISADEGGSPYAYPVVDGILLPPSQPANPPDSEFPSVDAASPEPDVVDPLSSVKGFSEVHETMSSVAGTDETAGEVEGEILVAHEGKVGGEGKEGMKRKRVSEGEVSVASFGVVLG